MEQYSDREIRQLVRLSSRRYFQNVAGSFRSLQVEVFIALAAEASSASLDAVSLAHKCFNVGGVQGWRPLEGRVQLYISDAGMLR